MADIIQRVREVRGNGNLTAIDREWLIEYAFSEPEQEMWDEAVKECERGY